MTLSNNYDEYCVSKTDIQSGSTNLDSLYCSHLWSNSNLRKAIINTANPDSKEIKYCYTCKGKIRKYELKSVNDHFVPNDHSTPNGKIKDINQPADEIQEHSFVENSHSFMPNIPKKDNEIANVETNQCIPSISHQIDSSFRHKFTSYEIRPGDINQRRLRKSLRGIGCIVNFSLTDSSVKKRTQIQACSIIVMIVAIVVISFVLVNFTTPNFIRTTNVASTIVVPTKFLDSNESSTTISNVDSDINKMTSTTRYATTIEPFISTTENISLTSVVISKIRKNIRTYPKDIKRQRHITKPKDIINRDLSERFCSCQNKEVCMLNENTGTSICKEALDINDPTGCGGLCALETEACRLVDRVRGVRACRPLPIVTCLPDEWRCRDGLCVSAEVRCDGSIQCYDRSDELHCDCDLTKQFRCGHSMSCFSNTKLCDGVIDCWDGYDEMNCTAECPKEQFTCTDGQCILASRFCDGFTDCEDGSDEPHGCDGDCSAHEIRCKNHRCVPRTARCDGHDNCGDATDELQCS